jgi:hypothetical protein
MRHTALPVAVQVPPLTGHRHPSIPFAPPRNIHATSPSIQFIHFCSVFFFFVWSFISALSFRHPRRPLSPPVFVHPSPPLRLTSQGLRFLPSSAICFHLLSLRPSIFILVSRSLGLSRFVPPPPAAPPAAAAAAAAAAAPARRLCSLTSSFAPSSSSAACPPPLCSAGACSCSHLQALTDGR